MNLIVPGLVRATASVDREVVDRGGDRAMQGVYDRLVRSVIGEADKSAWKVAPESVHIRRGVETSFSVEFEAVWSPCSARLVGGEYDGDLLDVQRDAATGLPPEVMKLPYRGTPWKVDGHELPIITRNPEYRRAGVHAIDDVWIYILIA